MPRHRQPGRPRARVPTRALAALVTASLLVVFGRGVLAQLEQRTAAGGVVTAKAAEVTEPAGSSTDAADPAASASPSPPSTPAPSLLTSARGGVRCSGPGGAQAATLVRAVQDGIVAAVDQGSGEVSVAVHDLRSGLRCDLGGQEHYYAASIVKVATAAAVMWQSAREGESLSATEWTWVEQAITSSDNAAETRLWNRVGGVRGMAPFLEAAGMSGTEPNGQWGLTRTTALDEVRLLDRIAHGDLLGRGDRDRLLALMRSVESTQRWGVDHELPGSATAALKNGWYPAEGVWRVHSMGWVSGPDSDYTIAVLSSRHASFDAGVEVVERVAGAVNAALARA